MAVPRPDAAETAVDVIVTAHNMEDVLEEALRSLATQTHANLRVLVVEDGSSDDTTSVAEAFCANDDRFSLVHTSPAQAAQPCETTVSSQLESPSCITTASRAPESFQGVGPAAARNVGLQWVEAPYCLILDGDDVFRPAFVESLLASAERTQADIVVCGMVERDHATGKLREAPWALKLGQLAPGAGEPNGLHAFSWRSIPGNLFAAFMGWPWDKLYRTAYLREHGFTFPTDLPNSEDALFTFPALVRARRIAVVGEPLVEHRMGRGGTVSTSRTEAPEAFYEAIVRLRDFLQAEPSPTWEKLRQPFLSWAFDWTLWNIESMPEGPAREQLLDDLFAGRFEALELERHAPTYYTGYPRSMARYATLAEGRADADHGPLGPLDTLPYGRYKPWSHANALEKLGIRWRIRRNKPVVW